MFKKALESILEPFIGVVGASLVATAIDDYHMSIDTIINTLETTQGVLGWVTLFVTTMLAAAKVRKNKTKNSSALDKETLSALDKENQHYNN